MNALINVVSSIALTLFDWLLYTLDIITPRFVTDIVLLEHLGNDEYAVLCNEADWYDGLKYDCIASIRSFNFFGASLFAKILIIEE